jgi:hypothetical protein
MKLTLSVYRHGSPVSKKDDKHDDDHDDDHDKDDDKRVFRF